MNKIYDNGEMLLGEVKNIREYTQQQFKNNNIEEWEKDNILNELEEFDQNDIVTINYDNGMGLSIDFWTESDVIGGNK